MNKTILAIALTALAGSSVMTSCKIVRKETAVQEVYGPTMTKSYELGQFKEIELNGGADMVYRKGAPSLRIEAPAEILKLIRVVNNNGRLIVNQEEFQKHTFITTDYQVRIICTSPEINYIVLNGSGDINIDSLSTTQLQLEINGAGDVSYRRGTAGVVKLTLNGSGDFDIEGLSGKVLQLNLNGAGDADFERIDFDEVAIDIEGAGDVAISGKARKAMLRCTGAGEIDAEKFSCPDMTTSADGIGKIKH